MDLKRAIWPVFVLATVLYYSILLFAPEASIHWDLADVSYPVQKYISDSLAQGSLPRWTPYIFSGTPLLADPQAGAWYPLHWPFFLMGAQPRLLAWELALHAFLALAGAYLLARRLFGDPVCAMLAGVLYAWGGYFAAHSTDLALFEAAALFPWLLWLAAGALASGDRIWMALAGLVGGLMVLTGSLDGAAYGFFALVCFVLGSLGLALFGSAWRKTWPIAAAVAILVPFLAAVMGAVVLVPWWNIAAYTTRTGANAAGLYGAVLNFRSLGTVLSADHLGMISGGLQSADDPRQMYLYGGLLAVPLAVAGLLRAGARLRILALILPALWYAVGPAGPIPGMFGALRWIPVFRDARAPVEIWFVVALGLALAASYGAAWLVERTGRPRLAILLIVLSSADLWFWNFYKNPLVLAHVSFETLYQRGLDKFRESVGDSQDQRFARIFAPQVAPTLGPMDGALIVRTAVTYGHNLLQLNRHAEYVREAAAHPALLATLATHALALRGRVTDIPGTLGLVSAPQRVQFVADAATARALLRDLNPAEEAIAEAPAHEVAPGLVDIRFLRVEENNIRINYSTAGDALLRFAIPFAPGWSATVGGQPTPVIATDYAFSGVLVPSGAREVELSYRLPGLAAGAVVSPAGLVVLLALAFFPKRFVDPGR